MSNLLTNLLINGEWRQSSSGRLLRQVNPATEECFAQVTSAGPRELDEAVRGADNAFHQGWRDLNPGKRTEVLFKLAQLLKNHAESIAQLETQNIGKPLSDARDEALLGARVFEYYAGAVTMCYGQTIPVSKGGFDFTLRQPLGVVAAIVPWNFPYPIACWKVAPALAAGNCVVLKPASWSPLSALMLGQLALEAGVPAGVLQVLPGLGEEIGSALAGHPLVQKISFTGSTEVGSRLMAVAAKEIKRLSLELGGKSPNIVFADADWEKAASTSPMGVFANTGQDCCARSRVFIERPIFQPFVERFIEAARQLRVGDPLQVDTQVGPLVRDSQRAKVEAFLAEAKTTGKAIRSGGDRPASRGYYLNPAVVLDAGPGDRIWEEEVFGPVVCLRPFDDEAAMVQEVNATRYGLSGSLWTNDLRRALRVARKIESGVLSINCHSSVHVEAPFGGFKQSGLGRDLGMQAMEGYTELKNVYVAE